MLPRHRPPSNLSACGDVRATGCAQAPPPQLLLRPGWRASVRPSARPARSRSSVLFLLFSSSPWSPSTSALVCPACYGLLGARLSYTPSPADSPALVGNELLSLICTARRKTRNAVTSKLECSCVFPPHPYHPAIHQHPPSPNGRPRSIVSPRTRCCCSLSSDTNSHRP